MTKIKQESDGHYYEKIVTWEGEYDHKIVLPLFASMNFMALIIIGTSLMFNPEGVKGGIIGGCLLTFALVDIGILFLGYLGKTRKVELKRIK
jgi:hypothetical protein